MRVQIPETTLFEDLGGEAVLLNLRSGVYFGLDAVGTRMWRALRESGGTEEAVRNLLPEFEVEEARLARDIEDLVGRLAQSGLLVIEDAAEN